jgi:hypothetical protein
MTCNSFSGTAGSPCGTMWVSSARIGVIRRAHVQVLTKATDVLHLIGRQRRRIGVDIALKPRSTPSTSRAKAGSPGGYVDHPFCDTTSIWRFMVKRCTWRKLTGLEMRKEARAARRTRGGPGVGDRIGAHDRGPRGLRPFSAGAQEARRSGLGKPGKHHGGVFDFRSTGVEAMSNELSPLLEIGRVPEIHCMILQGFPFDQ